MPVPAAEIIPEGIPTRASSDETTCKRHTVVIARGNGFGVRISVGGWVTGYSYSKQRSAAEDAGLPIGARIVSIGDEPVATKADIVQQLACITPRRQPNLFGDTSSEDEESCATELLFWTQRIPESSPWQLRPKTELVEPEPELDLFGYDGDGPQENEDTAAFWSEFFKRGAPPSVVDATTTASQASAHNGSRRLAARVEETQREEAVARSRKEAALARSAIKLERSQNARVARLRQQVNYFTYVGSATTATTDCICFAYVHT